MAEKPYLSLRNLTKSYDGRTRALDGVSMDIARGEFMTLLGPSGSGKTTTLLLIAGFERPTAGEIDLDGKAVAGVPAHLRNIGVVFQNYALFPHMSVERNVGFPLRMRRRPSSEIGRRVADALALVGLTEHATKHPRELSGGQQQRVALARALVFGPDLLLLDEPLGALDKNLREQMQFEIKRIQQDVGITTIYVTHDQTEAMTMSDRVAVYNIGHIEQIGPPLEVYKRPSTRFVGESLGVSNFLTGVTTDAADVEVDGLGSLRVGDLNGLGSGVQVDVMVRAEEIRVLEPGTGSPDANAFDMAISGTINYGDSVLLLGRIGPQELRVKLQGSAARNVIGARACRVEWRPESVHVIPASPERGGSLR